MSVTISENVSKAARHDILELQQKIRSFEQGQENEERFKAFRLTRGVYGQRQLGVQMLRIKLPLGRITPDQLDRIADISEKYTDGNLHLTTRQDIQLHYIKLKDTPQIWAELEDRNVTTKEACGNTVRNITASPAAGIDPDEPFDVSPYAYTAFEHLLRNPICQEMGRKVKIAFSSSEKDTALTYLHDFGFIPQIKKIKGKPVRGFKVFIGGGLGAQSIPAQLANQFLPEKELLRFLTAAIRVFDRYGERSRRMKARLKFLIKEHGLEQYLQWVEEELYAIGEISLDTDSFEEFQPPHNHWYHIVKPEDKQLYDQWKSANVFTQKQSFYYAVAIKVPLGNISSATARKLGKVVRRYASQDIRVTVNQGLLLRFVKKEALPDLFNQLRKLGLADSGFDRIPDITACPGTDTCNLGVTNSTGLALQLEQTVRDNFPELIDDPYLKIKISGCMNSCGQHMIANIGFHGSSIKKDKLVIPAMQVVLGGGIEPDNSTYMAEKVIKLPTKRLPRAVIFLLGDYLVNRQIDETFNRYYYRKGKRYFYDLLKPLADVSQVEEQEYIDWGQDKPFQPEIGVGECAGVAYDVVGSILADAHDKFANAERLLKGEYYADSVYEAYNAAITSAKATLLSVDVQCNTQANIIEDFDNHFGDDPSFRQTGKFSDFILQISKHRAAPDFVQKYLKETYTFLNEVTSFRELQLKEGAEENKRVIENNYKA